MPSPVTTLTLFPGFDGDRPFQCKDLAGSNAVFQAADVLTADVRVLGSNGPQFTPAVTWNTRNGQQTGYDQGQVLVTFFKANTLTLQPNRSYIMSVYRQLGSAPSKSEPIARANIQVEPLA